MSKQRKPIKYKIHFFCNSNAYLEFILLQSKYEKNMSELIKEAEAYIPTDWGDFRMIAYKSDVSDYDPEIVMVHPDMDANAIVTIRIHSECITGDLFHSQRCDCGAQLDAAMKIVAKEKGLLIYLRQEGRGIGIINKLKAYNKQDEGLDTIEANEALGLEIDGRKYGQVIQILQHLGISRINLLTNNPVKMSAFDSGPVDLVERLSLEIVPTENSTAYLKTKKDSMGHLLSSDKL